MIKYIGKCLLIKDLKKILVVGDLHIGRGRGYGEAGRIVMREGYNQVVQDIEEIFRKTGRLDTVILLGDIKNSFDSADKDERYGLINLLDILAKNSKEVKIIEGNHDKGIRNIIGERKEVMVTDHIVVGSYGFLHGDKRINLFEDKKIKIIITGHLHPAIELSDGIKKEIYKCFLEGTYKDKKVIILPSFFENNKGIDIRENTNNLAYDFDLKDFEVIAVGENLKTFRFGKLNQFLN